MLYRSKLGPGIVSRDYLLVIWEGTPEDEINEAVDDLAHVIMEHSYQQKT